MPSLVLLCVTDRLFQGHFYKAKKIIRTDVLLVGLELDLSLVDLCPLGYQYVWVGVIPHWELPPVFVYVSFV